MVYKVSTLFTANYDNLKSAITGVKSQFKSVQQSASAAKTTVSNTFKTVNSDIKDVNKSIRESSELIDTLTKASAIGVATITVPILLAGKSALTMAGQYEAATQTLEYTLGDAKEIVDDFVQSNSQAIGMAEQDAYKFANIYSNLLTTMTTDQQTNAEYTNKLMQASAVIMSKTGRTFTDVADRIRSGLLGNTEAIEDLGVNVNVALLQTTDAFKQIANGRSWENLSFQEQQQVRLLGILEQTTKKYGEEVGQNLNLTLSQTSAKFENIKTEASKLLAVGLQPMITGVNHLMTNILVFVKWLNTLDEGTKRAITTFVAVVAIVPVVALVFSVLIKAINGYIIFANAASASTIALAKTMAGLLGTVLLLVAGVAMLGYGLGLFGNTSKSVNKVANGTETASKAVNGLSSAQSKNAKSAKEASKANKELADNLQGFDEINKLNLDNGSNSNIDTVNPTIDLSGLDTDAFDNIDGQFEELTDKVSAFENKMEDLKPVIAGVGAVFTGLGLLSTINLFKKLLPQVKSSSRAGSTMVTNWSKVGTVLGKVGLVVGGLTEGIYYTNKTFDDYEDVVDQANKGTVDFYGNALDATQSITGMAGAGATIGLVFGPVGALVGVVAGSIAGLVTNIIAYNKTLDSVAKSNIYGNMQIQAEQLEIISQQITGSYQKQSEQLTAYKEKIQELSTSVDESVESLQSMSLGFSLLEQQITQEGAENIYNTISDLASNSIALIDESMNQTLTILQTTFDKTNVLTADEEKDILKTTVQANNIRKEKISETQNSITKTYENAIKTRGYLTDDEYIYISEQLNKIRELTNTQMQLSAGEQEKLKRQINDRNYKLDEESYNKINKQIEEANKTALELIEDNYNQRYAEAIKAGEDAKLLAQEQGKTAEEQERAKQEAINTIARTLQEEYNQDIKTANATTEQLRDAYAERLLQDWKELNDKNSRELTEVEKRQKEFLEEMLANFGISGTELIKKAKEVGTGAGKELTTSTTNNVRWKLPALPSLNDSAKKLGKDGAESLNKAWNKGLNLGISNLPTAIKFSTETSGTSVLLKPSLKWYANGGVFGNKSIIGVGEYAGARSNPEIVAPQSMIYDASIEAIRDSKQSGVSSNNGSDSITKKIEVELNLKSGGVKLGKQIVDLVLDANDFYDLGLV